MRHGFQLQWQLWFHFGGRNGIGKDSANHYIVIRVPSVSKMNTVTWFLILYFRIWTLLRQNPLEGSRPVVKRALILAPSSLVANWQAEFMKWLGSERIRVFAVDASNRVTEYIKRPNLPVLVLDYFRLPVFLEYFFVKRFQNFRSCHTKCFRDPLMICRGCNLIWWFVMRVTGMNS